MSGKPTLATIVCPMCSQTLPGWADKCQFCGHQIAKGYVRPTDAYKYKIDNRLSWQEVAYIIVSVIMLLDGVYTLLQAGGIIPNPIFKVGGSAFLAFFGGIQTLLGTGLLLQQIWAQFITKLLGWLAIAGAAAGTFMSLLVLGTRGGVFVFLFYAFWLAFWCFTVYLINNVGDA